MLYEGWPALQTSLGAVITASSLREPETIDSAETLLVLLDAVATTVSAYGDEIFAQDLAALLAAFMPASRGWFGATWALCTNADYRAARRTLRMLRHKPASDAHIYAEVLAAVDQVQRWHEQSGAQPNVVPVVDTARTDLAAFRSDLTELTALLDQPHLLQQSFADLVQLLETLAVDSSTPFRIPRLLEIERHIDELHAGMIIAEIRKTQAQPQHWPLLFEHAWLASCLDAARAEEPTLAGFHGRTHEGFISEFCDFDRQRLSLAATRVRRTQAEQVIATMNAFPEQAALVRREAEKKSRHLPLRRLLAQAPDVLTSLRPCWMASPLSVSQLLDAGQRYFDVVIFDEASQVPPE
ncbi:MAG: hypothetical protein CYG59_17795, partial [Chloroflexi bacterium]